MKKNIIVTQLGFTGEEWQKRLLLKHGIKAFINPSGGWQPKKFDSELPWTLYMNTRMSMRPSNNLNPDLDLDGCDLKELILKGQYVELGSASLPYLPNIPCDWTVIGVVRHPETWVQSALQSGYLQSDLSWEPTSGFDYAKIWLYYTEQILNRADIVFRIEDILENPQMFLNQFWYFGETYEAPSHDLESTKADSGEWQHIIETMAERLNYTSQTTSNLLPRYHNIKKASPANFSNSCDESTMFVIDKSRGLFGDQLYGGWLVGSLIANGLKAALVENSISHLLDVPIFQGNFEEHHRYWEAGGGIADLQAMKEYFNLKELKPLDYVPVKYEDIPEIESYDVAIVSTSHQEGLTKNWPFFDRLKRQLNGLNIKWIDLSEMRDIVFLNYVNKAKLFLGIETGATVYASQFIRNKNIIIRSKYRSAGSPDWNIFNYHTIVSSECRTTCDIDKISDCPHRHVCMRSISVQQVLKEIVKCLKIMQE